MTSICRISLATGALAGTVAWTLDARDLAVGLWMASLAVPGLMLGLGFLYICPCRCRIRT